MDDEAYWIRFGDRKLKTDWPYGSRERVLKEQFPGCENTIDAVRSLLKKTPQKNQTASQSMEMTPAEKFKQVSNHIGNALEDLDESQIPQETRDKLAAMPLETVEEIRAWGIAWLKAIKDYL